MLNWITWGRATPGGNKKTYKTTKEEIFWCINNEEDYVFNKQFRIMRGKYVLPYKNEDGTPRGWFVDEHGERCRWAEIGNVWLYTRPFWSMPEKTKHPMQKPRMMCDRIILTSSNESDTILDVFTGSGSFCESAKRLNRNFIGIEKNKEYYKIAKKRI